MAISQRTDATSASPIAASLVFSNLKARYSIPNISVHADRRRALSRRKYKPVPDLPAGWRAVFGVTQAIMPIFMTAPQLRTFYTQVAQSVLHLDNHWRWTFQMGHLVLQLTSRDRRRKLVTPELVVATVMMLTEFASGGFTDLFVARLWDEVDGGIVDIQLRISSQIAEGIKVTR
ncbi:MAG: hypothetical protein L6R41_007224 [Letrouitia leprolyta]|nr:MAG: hypothetical protein L6R41_007224 [Letrouitia leprolyta]